MRKTFTDFLKVLKEIIKIHLKNKFKKRLGYRSSDLQVE